MEQFGEEALRKLYLGLLYKDDWDEECDGCRMPALLHIDSDGKQSLDSCPGRKEESTAAAQNKADAEILKSYRTIKNKMGPVRKWHRQEMEKTQATNDILAGIQSMTAAIINGNNERPSKLVKPTKVPSWGTGMKYQAYRKSIEVWEQNNQDMPEPA